MSSVGRCAGRDRKTAVIWPLLRYASGAPRLYVRTQPVKTQGQSCVQPLNKPPCHVSPCILCYRYNCKLPHMVMSFPQTPLHNRVAYLLTLTIHTKQEKSLIACEWKVVTLGVVVFSCCGEHLTVLLQWTAAQFFGLWSPAHFERFFCWGRWFASLLHCMLHTQGKSLAGSWNNERPPQSGLYSLKASSY